MRVDQFQDDEFEFRDKISGRHIKIIKRQFDPVYINNWNVFVKDFIKIKQNKIMDNNTNLYDYCETN